MGRKFKLSDTQRLAIRAAYDKMKIEGSSGQKAMEKVADEFGVHWQTIRTILKNTTPVDKQVLKDVKEQQASKLDNIVNKLLADFDGSDKFLKGLSPGQVPMAIAILIDKKAKLLGEDVTKVEIHQVGEKIEKRLAEITAIEEALKKSMVLPKDKQEN
jgi:hypothetical protein